MMVAPLKRPPPLERQDQAAYFEWLYITRYCGDRLWDYAFAIPNGAFLAGTTAQRARQAHALALQGLKRGYPDVAIDIAVAPYHGLRIEFKRIGAPKPGDDQSRWHAKLRKQGYAVEVCFGLNAAIAITREYFKL